MLKKSKLLVVFFSLVMLFNLSIEACGKDFKDLAKTSWAYDAVSEMTNLGVINGYTDGTFKPSNKVTRAEFAKLLVATLDLSETKKANPIKFEDVPETYWGYKYILSAGNYLTGYTLDDKIYFYPNKNAVREDMAVAVVVASGLSNFDYSESTLKKFKDIESATPSLKKYIAIAVEHGLMKGNANGTFNPKGNLTRAEAAQLMLNFNNSEKVSIEDYEKLLKDKEGVPVVHDEFGFIDLGENYKNYRYSEDGKKWFTPTSRYLNKTTNPNVGTCNNFYGTDIQIKDTKDNNRIYTFKVPYIAEVDINFNESKGEVDLGENWHAFDILNTDIKDLSTATKGSFKWVEAPERVIKKGSNSYNLSFLYVRYKEKDKSSYAGELLKVGEEEKLTWKKSDKKIEYTGTSYKLTEDNGKYYITVGAGKKLTGGYSIDVVDVHIDGRNVTLDVQQTYPSKSEIVTQEINYPAATIELNAKPLKITVKKLANITREAGALTWSKTDKKLEYTGTSYKVIEDAGKVYLVVGLGKKTTGGYSIEIKDVHISGTEVTLDVQTTSPGKGAVTTQVINYPTDIIELSGKPTKVTINKLAAIVEDAEFTLTKVNKNIEYTSTSYKYTTEDGKTYITVGMGRKQGSGFDIDIEDFVYSNGTLTLYTRERIPLHPELMMTMPYYPTCTAEISFKPSKVVIEKLDPIYTGEEIDPVPEPVQDELTWKKTDKRIEYKQAGYTVTAEGDKIYLTVGIGQRSNGGYSVEIDNVQISGLDITLDYIEFGPEPGMSYTTAITYPTATIELSRRPNNVKLNKSPSGTGKVTGLTPINFEKTNKKVSYNGTEYTLSSEDGKIYFTVGAGMKTHGGYSIEILSIQAKGTEWIVTTLERMPGARAITTQAINYPTCTVIVPSRPSKVTFNRQVESDYDEPVYYIQ